ncbi:ATP dependent DNA ligase domain protein [Aspergillus melleus]|uniref:ATP dependent DNA ligase domain protein n=1 Tax=Aspergillus melleus TaxID=138277 RepID=UPI001E8E6BFC|nr:uncharacterized protein LDX57_008339 [Aspergillus melleus]KAH8430677.1 hypothetical protein LDX57_008339 [Aspergillus melleus]
MGFKFQHLCDLLSSLENNRILKAATHSRSTDPDARIVSLWFRQHAKRLRKADTDQLAVLSCLFPEKRTDRVYMLQDVSLSRVIGRCLLLGSSRREELEKWRVSGGADLGQCVENVMKQAENQIFDGQEVTVEEIDSVLAQIASRSRFSGPRVRRQRTAVDVEEALSPIYRRLGSRDAKWLTRMILKCYYPVVVPEGVALRSLHFLLPRLLLFQNSFEAALSMLRTEPLSYFPAHPEPGQATDLGAIGLKHLYPVTGVKIGRPDYYKARSIKHCCQMIDGRRMSIEKKYDGEYCQIHIDLSRPHDPIQIFSKSGKDSTEDRAGIQEVLKDSLRMKTPDCKFSRRCIVEGELVVWSDAHRRIMDFHKLRKFISRSGTFIGTENDSQPHPDEHLMIVFFDVLLLDDDVCLRKPHRERRLLLKSLVKLIHGRADIAEQRVLDFSHPGSQSRLEALLGKGIAERWEGFVLKGCEDPYFTFAWGTNASSGRWIKLKKDYIPGLGDTVDLTIIGGSYNARDAVALRERHKEILWTHFFIGCLVNKDSVLQSMVKPRFRVIDVIDRNGISPQNMQILNQVGEFSACAADSDHHGFDIEFGHGGLPSMATVFKKPFIVEMLGGGFEKPSSARYFTLRFPRILKIHSDRSFEEAASFTELQLLADEARAIPSEELAQEQQWSKRLKLGDGSSKYIVDRSQSMVSTTASSSPPASSASAAVCDPRQSGVACRSGTTQIPIYVDTSRSSSPRSDVSEPAGHFLTSTENLPNQQKDFTAASRSNMDPKSTLRLRHPEYPTNPGLSIEFKVRSKEPKLLGKEVPKSKTLSNVPHASNTHSKNPLSTIPIYLDGPLYKSRDKDETILATTLTTTSSLMTFLQTIQSQPAKSQGLVLLDTQKTPLGSFILTLTKTLHHQLLHTHSSPGKILIFDSAFLEIPASADDTIFSLSEAWSGIAREYFYACVKWNTDTVGAGFPGTGRRMKEKNRAMGKEGYSDGILSCSEILCTPMPTAAQTRPGPKLDDPGAENGASTSTVPCGMEGDIPRFSICISFDRSEVSCLGEFGVS